MKPASEHGFTVSFVLFTKPLVLPIDTSANFLLYMRNRVRLIRDNLKLYSVFWIWISNRSRPKYYSILNKFDLTTVLQQ